MVASPESLLIDNDMCGAILRTVRGIEVSDEMLDLDSIERVVTGEGHYLAEAQTLKLMKSEYIYPELGNRQSVADWLDAGAESIWQRASDRVRDLLKENTPTHLDSARDKAIRQAFDQSQIVAGHRRSNRHT